MLHCSIGSRLRCRLFWRLQISSSWSRGTVSTNDGTLKAVGSAANEDASRCLRSRSCGSSCSVVPGSSMGDGIRTELVRFVR